MFFSQRGLFKIFAAVAFSLSTLFSNYHIQIIIETVMTALGQACDGGWNQK